METSTKQKPATRREVDLHARLVLALIEYVRIDERKVKAIAKAARYRGGIGSVTVQERLKRNRAILKELGAAA